jgi:hypothetical protein
MSTRRFSFWFTGGMSILTITVAFGSVIFGQSMPPAERIRQVDRMIDAIASRNKPPVLVHASDDSDSPFVPRDPYDWSEQERVQRAIKAVQNDKSDEMWRRLRGHYGDKRYAMTLVFDGVVNSKDVSVGEICAAMPGPDYDAAYIRHFPKVSGWYVFDPASIMCDKKWAGKPLYEQQIAVCEEAIKQFNLLIATEEVSFTDYRAGEKAHTFTAEEKVKFAEAVRKEIEELKRTKKPVIGPEKPLGIYKSAWEPLEPHEVKKARTKVDK